MKKRKLNSKNPKFQPLVEIEKTTRKLITNKNGVKVYAVYKK